MTTPTAIRIDEAVVPLSEAVTEAPTGNRFPALLIKAGWSLNGRYYGEAMLRRDGAAAFPAGSQMSCDHPSFEERQNRPEGSIRSVLSTIATTPKWSAKHKGLVAEVEVFPQGEGLLNERFRRAIGLSIRTGGTGEQGEAEGRKGLIVTALDEGGTVDWVTHPGAGGRVLDLLESAPLALEAHGMTANDLRRALQAAVDDTYAAMCCWAWVCDYADEFVIYDLSGRDAEDGRYQQTYTVDAAGTASLTGTPVQVNTQTTYVPVLTEIPAVETAPAAAPATTQAPPTTAPVTESTPTPKEAVPVTTPAPNTGAPPTGAPASAPRRLDTLEEARAYALEMEQVATNARAIAESKADDRAARIKAETDAAEARYETARFRAMEAARSVTQVALNESRLPECVYSRVIANVTGTEGRAIPLTESATVDADKLAATVASVVKDWQMLVDQILEANGAGKVRGMGAPAEGGTELTEAQAFDRSKARFIKQGMSEAAATVAARGRG